MNDFDPIFVESSCASIFVMSKGFAVSEDTEEFQLLIPSEFEHLKTGQERFLVSQTVWPTILSKHLF